MKYIVSKIQDRSKIIKILITLLFILMPIIDILRSTFIKEIETNTYINPGSISLPKSEYGPTYLYYDEERFVIFDLNDHELFQKNTKN